MITWVAAGLAAVPAALPTDGAAVDWLSWAAADRDVAELSTAIVAGAAASRSLNGDPAAVYAVDAEVTEVGTGDRKRQWVELREAVLYRNRSARAQDQLTFHVFANGRDRRPENVLVNGVWVDNVPARFALRGDRLVVQAPSTIRPGDSARILLHLAEPVPRFEPRAGAPPVGSTTAAGTFGQADGALNLASFVPVLVDPDAADLPSGAVYRPPGRAASTFYVVLRVPSAYEVATTGVEVERSERGSERTIVAVASGVRDFSAALLPDGQFASADLAGTQLRVLTLRGANPQALELMRLLGNLFEVYGRRFGPLGSRQVDLVEAPLLGGYAAAFSDLVLVDVSHQGRGFHLNAAAEGAVAKEVARLWWGGEVGSDPLAEPWVDEALVAFSASLYWEEIHGLDAASARFEYEVVDRAHLLARSGRPDLAADLPTFQYAPDQYSVSGRASAFLVAARTSIGDERFFRNLGGYLKAHRAGTATGDDLLRSLARGVKRRPFEALAGRWLREAHTYEDLVPPR
jgi:hypothetical protein